MRKRRLKRIRENKNSWQIQEAKAKSSQLVKDAKIKRSQTITRLGESVAVSLSEKEFDPFTQFKGAFINFFKAAPCPEVELNVQHFKDLPRELDL